MSVKQKQYDLYVTSGQAGQDRGFDPEIRFAGNRPYIEQTIRRHIPSDRALRIVDLGCGHGGWIYFLKKLGYGNVAGVDISAEQVQLAHSLGIPEVRQGDLDEFIESESSIDVAIMMDILEHFTITETDALLRNLLKKMHSNSRLIIHVPNGEGLFGQRIRYGDLTHETCFTRTSMRQLFASLGVGEIQCFEDKPIVHGLISAIRRVIWEVGALYPRLMLAAETGERRCILTQNMTVMATGISQSEAGAE